MATNPTIWPAEPDDAEAIADVHAASWRATYHGTMPEAYLETLTAESRRPMWDQVLTTRSSRVDVWVLELEGKLAGFAWTGPCLAKDCPATTGELYAIYLQPGLEGRGLGRLLLVRAETALAGRGFTEAILHVVRDNAHARRFYEAAGWTTDGAERHDEVLGAPVIELAYRKTLPTVERRPGGIRSDIA